MGEKHDPIAFLGSLLEAATRGVVFDILGSSPCDGFGRRKASLERSAAAFEEPADLLRSSSGRNKCRLWAKEAVKGRVLINLQFLLSQVDLLSTVLQTAKIGLSH